MRLLRMIGFSVMVFVAAAAVAAAESEEKTPPAMPVAVVENGGKYNCPAMLEGNEIRHDFIIRNTGDAPLIIEKVDSGCGCTTVSFTKSIPAGGEGTVNVKINTTGYGGRRLSKISRAYTNDPNNKVLHLNVTCEVETFADIRPSLVRFNGPVGAVMKQQVLVFAKQERPFKITFAKARTGKYIRIELKNTKDDSGRSGYLIEVENLKTDAGAYQDDIVLKTNSKTKPTLDIRVYGSIYDPTFLEDEKPDQARDENGTP